MTFQNSKRQKEEKKQARLEEERNRKTRLNHIDLELELSWRTMNGKQKYE
jgi:hypothetical protein